MAYDLDGKSFRPTASAGRDLSPDTIFHVHQIERIVWAHYFGGDIVTGHFLAVMDDDGRLDLRYHHVTKAGELRTGKSVATPEDLPDDRIGFHERWESISGEPASGEFRVEEIVSEDDEPVPME